MSRRSKKPVDYASMQNMDFSDDEDFIVNKKKAAEKLKKERRAEKPDKRRSTDEPTDSSKKPKKGKTPSPKKKTPSPKKNESKVTNANKEDVIKLDDSDDSNHAEIKSATSAQPPLKEPNASSSAAAAVSSPIRTKPQTDDREDHAQEKESTGFVSATKVLEEDDDAFEPPGQDSDHGEENEASKKTPKAIASFKGKTAAEQKATASFKVVPQVSERLKSLSKWTPPGPVGSNQSPNITTTPNSGLRMGLSRNSRPKPLHPLPKLL